MHTSETLSPRSRTESLKILDSRSADEAADKKSAAPHEIPSSLFPPVSSVTGEGAVSILPSETRSTHPSSDATSVVGKYFVATYNKTGYALSEVLDDITRSFIEFSATARRPVLEIGAAFGIASLEALKRGATVIVNDLDDRHLQVFAREVPEVDREKVTLMAGSFPGDIKLKKDSISAVLCCRVIHFFNPETVTKAIKDCFDMLEVGGKAFFTVESPYLKNWGGFSVEFNAKKDAGELFPGYVKTRDFIKSGEIADNLPEYMHFFDEDTLATAFKDAGFEIERCFLFARPYFPAEVQLDGRESVGIVAVKK